MCVQERNGCLKSFNVLPSGLCSNSDFLHPAYLSLERRFRKEIILIPAVPVVSAGDEKSLDQQLWGLAVNHLCSGTEEMLPNFRCSNPCSLACALCIPCRT